MLQYLYYVFLHLVFLVGGGDRVLCASMKNKFSWQNSNCIQQFTVTHNLYTKNRSVYIMAVHDLVGRAMCNAPIYIVVK